MGPRSWQPLNSVAQNESITVEIQPKVEPTRASTEKTKTNPSPTPTLIKTPTKNENVKISKSKSRLYSNQLEERPSSVAKISKSLSNNSAAKSPSASKFTLTKSLARNKTFISPNELKKSTTTK